MKDDDSLQQVRATLDALKSTAVAEEATGFDASGSSSLGDGYGPDASGENSAESRETDLTSLSNAMSSIDMTEGQSASANEELAGIEDLPTQDKAGLLKEIFPSLNDFTISHALQKHHNKWRPTLDDLLNQVYLSENQDQDATQAKGIDAFSEDNTARRGRKGKKRKQLRFDEYEQRSTSLPSTPYTPTPVANKWQAASEEVNGIATLVDLPVKTVASIYSQQNASMQRTIATILKDWLEKHANAADKDPSLQVDAYELGHDFPFVSEQYLIALVGITHPSTATAHELAKALTTKGTSQDSLSHKVIPQYAPLRISEDDDTPTVPVAYNAANSSLDFTTAFSRASTLNLARSAAMTQARAAYRKAKSDRLMGGAAAYYSQVGRDLRESSSLYSAAAADSLVASQSSSSHIDLHGVTVDDALRITRIKVNQWWENLGESRVNGRVGAADRAQGFRIVTGAGKHSKGGKGVLGPAVKKSLEKDGWNIEPAGGEILVKGKLRVC